MAAQDARRVLLLCAAFDPIHVGQLITAAELATATCADEVVLVPRGAELESIDPSVSLLQRLTLLHLALDSTIDHRTPIFGAPLTVDDTTEGIVRKVCEAAEARAAPGQHVDYTVYIDEREELQDRDRRAWDAALRIAHGRRLFLRQREGGVGELAHVVHSAWEDRVEEGRTVPVVHLDHSTTMTITLSNITHRLVRRRLRECTGERLAQRARRLCGVLAPCVLDALRRYGWYARVVGGEVLRAESGLTEASSGASVSVSAAGGGATPAQCLPAPPPVSAYWSPAGEAFHGQHILPGDIPDAREALEPRARAAAEKAFAPDAPERRRVAVLGGSFHPITVAHVLIAIEVLAAGDADEVWVVPCGKRPDKPSLTVSTVERLVATFIALEESVPWDVPAFVVPAELYVPKALSTLQLVTALRERHPQCEFALIIGSDLVPSLPRWRDADLLTACCEFLCVPRPDHLRAWEEVLERVVEDAPASRAAEGRMLSAQDSVASVVEGQGEAAGAVAVEASGIAHLRVISSGVPGAPPMAHMLLSSTEIRTRLASLARGAPTESALRAAETLLPRSVLTHLLRNHVMLD